MARIASILLAGLLVAACDRNPEPPPGSKSAASEGPGPMAQGPSGSQGLPPGHPPTGNELPPGHPPTGQALPPGHPGAGGGTPQGEPGKPEAGGIAWEAPAPFEAQAPSSTMRAAQYVVQGTKGQEPATLVVYYFGEGQGGGVQANIDRWVGQFDLPAGKKPEIDKRTVNDLPVTLVDVTGSYQGMQMPGQPATGAQADQRMLAAIVEGPKGPVFFKMVGPAEVVAKASSAFDHLVGSVHPG